MNRHPKNVVVTQRDKEILVSLFKNKVLSAEQIQKFIFNGASKAVVLRRLSKLFQIKLIRKKPFQDASKIKMAYGISPKGVDVIREIYSQEITENYFTSDSILHDLTLTDISKTFEYFEVVSEVFTEAELLSCSEFLEKPNFRPFVELRSDRLLVLRNEKGVSFVSLEYERSIKGDRRIKKKLNDYYLNSGIEAVLYVCENQSICNALMKMDQKISQDFKSKIYFCTLSDVQNMDKKLIFTKHDNGKLTFT